MKKFFNSKEEKQILKEAENKVRQEREEKEKQQKIAEEKRKVKTYNRKKSEYDTRCWNFRAGSSGFERFTHFIASYTYALQQRTPFDVKANIKAFRLQPLADMINEMLEDGEKPPSKE